MLPIFRWEEMMTLIRFLISGAALLLLFAGVQAQGNAKHFAKDGLSFDYANGWAITDQSTSDAQQLTLTRADSEAQIRIFAHRGRVDSPEKMAQAKKAFIDPYVAATNNQFVQMGAKPERSTASTEIGGATAGGGRLRASLSGEAGGGGNLLVPGCGSGAVGGDFWRGQKIQKQ